MEPARLSATDLACRRGERVLFRGLSFSLGECRALQVIGPNGTGKSSLLRILAGLLRPLEGTVECNRPVALLDERLPLDGHLPLERALAFWERLDGSSYQTPLPVGEGLGVGVPPSPAASSTPTQPSPSRGRANFAGLETLAEVPVRYLSTGQRKRAAIVQSNARNASMWLLDEPLNGLDVDAAAAFQEQVAAYLAQGGIAVIASHQPFHVPGLERLHLADYAP